MSVSSGPFLCCFLYGFSGRGDGEEMGMQPGSLAIMAGFVYIHPHTTMPNLTLKRLLNGALGNG